MVRWWPSHHLNKCWVIVNWTLMNKLQWNFNRIKKTFVQENVCQNIVCEMASILSRVLVNSSWPSATYMRRNFLCSSPQCHIYGTLQTARSYPVPEIVVARPHLLSLQHPIYVACHGPLSSHELCGKIKMFHQNIGCSSQWPSSNKLQLLKYMGKFPRSAVI